MTITQIETTPLEGTEDMTLKDLRAQVSSVGVLDPDWQERISPELRRRERAGEISSEIGLFASSGSGYGDRVARELRQHLVEPRPEPNHAFDSEPHEEVGFAD